MISESVELQYVIELGAKCLVDDGCQRIPLSVKLARLEQLNQTWRTGGPLGLRELIAIPAPFPTYDLQCGILTLANREDSETFRSVVFHKLRSSVHGTAPEVRPSDDLGVTARDFTFDPSNDLIVYQEAG